METAGSTSDVRSGSRMKADGSTSDVSAAVERAAVGRRTGLVRTDKGKRAGERAEKRHTEIEGESDTHCDTRRERTATSVVRYGSRARRKAWAAAAGLARGATSRGAKPRTKRTSSGREEWREWATCCVGYAEMLSMLGWQSKGKARHVGARWH